MVFIGFIMAFFQVGKNIAISLALVSDYLTL